MEIISIFGNLLKEFKDLFLSKKLFVISFFAGIFCLLLLYPPKGLLEFFDIQLTTTQSSYLGIVSFTTLFVAASGAFYYAGKFILVSAKEKFKEKITQRNRSKTIEALTTEEKKILIPFVINKERSLALFESKTTLQLEEKEILYPMSMIFGARRSSPKTRHYHISEWAYRILMNDPSLIENSER